MTTPRDEGDAPRRFPHALLIAVTLLLALAIMAVIDGLDDQGITWWTGAKAIGVSVLVLAYFYLVPYRRRRRPE